MTTAQKNWVAALRSGQYQQDKNFLRRETNDGITHNFMGVACDISGIGQWEKVNLSNHYSYNIWPSETTRTLPSAVRYWLDIEPDLEGDHLMSKLVLLSNKGASFTELADAIEEAFNLKEKKGEKQCSP